MEMETCHNFIDCTFTNVLQKFLQVMSQQRMLVCFALFSDCLLKKKEQPWMTV